MYFLKTERLGFRAWAEYDIELANALWGDENVTRLIGGPFTEEQIRKRLATEIETLDEFGVQYWPIFLLSNDEHVGCCGLRPYEPEQRIFELGFHLRAPHQGQGLAHEAAQNMIGYAFSRIRASALFAGHHPENTPSRKLLLGLGFSYTSDQFYPPTGLNHPSYMLTLQRFIQHLAQSK